MRLPRDLSVLCATEWLVRALERMMCGRDVMVAKWAHVEQQALPLQLVAVPGEDPKPNYNRAPTQLGYVIAASEGGGAVKEARWGLLPPWAKDTKLAYSTFNARIETVAEKPAFRGAWKARRALIPSSGYYEWMKLDSSARPAKQPYFIHGADSSVLFFAGLWETRADGAGGELVTYTILMRDADPEVAHLHDRMPVMMPAALYHDWLHGTADQAMEIALSAQSPRLAFHPVDAAVGNVRNTGPHLMDPLPQAGLL